MQISVIVKKFMALVVFISIGVVNSSTFGSSTFGSSTFGSSAFAFSGGSTELSKDHEGHALKPKVRHFKFEGIMGKYDKHAVQRGLQVYRQVCSSCHSLKYLKFRNLGEKGGPLQISKCPKGFPIDKDCSSAGDNPYVKAIAAEYSIEDGPNDDGDMFERAGLPSDTFPNPYANEQIARLANAGSFPPDLSLITKARDNGPAYIYSLLTGFDEAPEFYKEKMVRGAYFNPYFAGWQISMTPPLKDGLVDYLDEDTPETKEQYAADVAEFLHWVAEPKLEARKSLGLSVMIYLFVFAIIVYISYRQIWKDAK